MLNQIIDPLKAWAEGVLVHFGLPAFFILTLLGAANIPIPSEVVMPIGGVMAADGKLNFHLMALTGTVGSVVGSLISYWIAARLGKDFLLKYGKYVLMRPSEVEHAEEWFRRHGLLVTLWGRFIPIVRSFISLPAGFFKADLARFTLYAILGSLPWCYGWAYVGLLLGKNWETVQANMKYVDVVVLLGLAALVARSILKRRRATESPAEV